MSNTIRPEEMSLEKIQTTESLITDFSQEEDHEKYRGVIKTIKDKLSPLGTGVKKEQVLFGLEFVLLNEAKNNFFQKDNKKTKTEKLEELRQHYLSAHSLNPSPITGHLLGLLSFSLGQYDDSLLFFDEAIKSQPKNSIFYDNRAVIKTEIGNITSALSDLDISININPNNPHTYNLRGELRLSKGNHFLALEDFSFALAKSKETTPERWSFLLNYGRALFESAKKTENIEKEAKLLNQSREYFEKAKKIKPTRPEPYFYRATLLSYLDSKTPEPVFDKHIFGSLLFSMCYCNESLRKNKNDSKLKDLSSQIKEELKKYSEKYGVSCYKQYA